MRSLRCLLVSSCLLVGAWPLVAQSTRDELVRRMTCKQVERDPAPQMLCDYYAGADLHFSIEGVGTPLSIIYFLRSNEQGTYWVRLIGEGCLMVQPGQLGPKDGEPAFVSRRTGRVFASITGCND